MHHYLQFQKPPLCYDVKIVQRLQADITLIISAEPGAN